MRFLPSAMRAPVSLAYLLARASDTLADTESVPAEVRLECLNDFEKGLFDPSGRDTLFKHLTNDFIPKQSHEKEALLLTKTHEVYAWLDSVDDWEMESIGKVLHTIIDGQRKDIERFSINGWEKLTSDDMLDDYCYSVAGCVGEFWTEVGFATDERFSNINQKKLTDLGVNFGKGLQLVNILRDLPNDVDQGRCYLPVEDISDRGEIMIKAAHVRALAREYLDDGSLYAKSVRKRSARMATALPMMLGVKTLDLLDEANYQDWSRGVKVSRSTVYKSMLKSWWF